jgi:hypothetical protein
MHLCVNTKIIPVETARAIRRGEMKESSEEVNLSMIYLIHCMNLYKSYSVLLLSTTIIN